ncbi:MAG: hypothetical protein LUG14_11030 [Synergistaceae bacterium]|nr:hypothetical protein [Synergistaceae bacterium]
MIVSSVRSKEKMTLALFALIVMLFAAGSPLSFASPGYADAGADIMYLSVNADDISFGTISIPADSVPAAVEKSLRNRDDNQPGVFRTNLPLLLEMGTEPSLVSAYLLSCIHMANARYCGISDPKTVQKRE